MFFFFKITKSLSASFYGSAHCFGEHFLDFLDDIIQNCIESSTHQSIVWNRRSSKESCARNPKKTSSYKHA